MTPITFTERAVEPTEVPREVWRMHFEKYTTYVDPAKGRQAFLDDLAKGEAMVNALASHGFRAHGADKILEGLSDNPYVRTWRRWVALQKVPGIARVVGDELDLDMYKKIVLFAVYKDVMEELQTALREHGVVRLFGGTPWDKREKLLKKFAKDKRCRVMICRVDAAGTAVDLTAASQVGVVECDWRSTANNVQALMRVYNAKQENPVTARYFTIADSLDEKVQRLAKLTVRNFLSE